MIRIGVLSDTHVNFERGLEILPAIIESYFKDVQMIIHAGDMVDPDILGLFGDRTVHAVRGNMDPPATNAPLKKIISVGQFRIGLIHGWGAPSGIEDRILSEFSAERLDCLVYGHSHQPVCHRKGGVLFFNPGSPTDRRWAPYHSVGLLEVGTEIHGQIIRLD